MKREIAKIKKQILIKVTIIICILILITILHYSIFKSFYSEIVHLFIVGLLTAYLFYLVSEFVPPQFKRKYFLLIWTLAIGGYFIAMIFDPILKPYLEISHSRRRRFSPRTSGYFKIRLAALKNDTNNFLFNQIIS